MYIFINNPIKCLTIHSIQIIYHQIMQQRFDICTYMVTCSTVVHSAVSHMLPADIHQSITILHSYISNQEELYT